MLIFQINNIITNFRNNDTYLYDINVKMLNFYIILKICRSI